MPTPLKILVAEDNPADADLLIRALRLAGFKPEWKCVDSEEDFLAAISPGLDLVISDYEMPQYSGLRALQLVKERCPEVPLIIVSGTIGEETAVEAMRLGAADYLMKDRLARLGQAVEHALAVARLRREHQSDAEELRASEQRFKALFEQAAVGVALADAATGRFVQVNQHYADILGRSREETEQLRFADITHPEDLAYDLEMARQIQAGPIREYSREKRYRRKDGSDVWVNLTVSAMWAPGDRPDYFIAVAQDISGRKQLEEQFRQAQKMEAIGTLAGGIAHDFNNVLAAINGYTELSRMMLKENPEVREYLGSVLQASSRAADLIRQILSFSRQQRTERKPIQLRPVMEESLKLLRATLPATIEFGTSFAADAPTVLADATQIHQILMNLENNAWHAMRDRTGRLQVKLERRVVDAGEAAAQPQLRPGIYARVSVRDTGSGMDQATLGRIFEPFFTTKPVGDGTGLGLAVVHGIMHTHDGAITVESQPGEGTVFHLYFPAHVGEVTMTAPEAGPVPRGHGERVLWVDDEKVLVQLGQKMLGSLGYAVEVATQPAEALALVRADPKRFALVLADQTMPGMIGLTLASQLRQLRPDLPIILMTGYAASLTPAQLEAAGINRILLKPATVHALGTAVQAALSVETPH
jgi:PAS domain S-box-containing protein